MKNLTPILHLTKYEEEIENYIENKKQSWYRLKRISPFTIYQIVDKPLIEICFYIYPKSEDITWNKYVHKESFNVYNYSEKKQALKEINSLKKNHFKNSLIVHEIEYPATYRTVIPFGLSELANNTLNGYHALITYKNNHCISLISKENIEDAINMNITNPDKEFYSKEQVDAYEKWFKS